MIDRGGAISTRNTWHLITLRVKLLMFGQISVLMVQRHFIYDPFVYRMSRPWVIDQVLIHVFLVRHQLIQVELLMERRRLTADIRIVLSLTFQALLVLLLELPPLVLSILLSLDQIILALLNFIFVAVLLLHHGLISLILYLLDIFGLLFPAILPLALVWFTTWLLFV